MKFLTIPFILLGALCLQGCAPRLDYDGPGEIYWRPKWKHSNPPSLEKMYLCARYGALNYIPIDGSQGCHVTDVGPIFSAIEKMHLFWSKNWLANFVSFAPGEIRINCFNGPSIEIRTRSVILSISSQRIADITEEQFQFLETLVLSLLQKSNEGKQTVLATSE